MPYIQSNLDCPAVMKKWQIFLAMHAKFGTIYIISDFLQAIGCNISVSGYILTHPQNLHERMLRRLHTMLWWIISYISHGLAKVRHTKFWVCMKHTGTDKEISYVVFFSFNDIELLILCHSWFKLHYLIMNLCLEFVTNPLVRCHLNLLLRLLYSLLRRFMLLFSVRHRCQWLISLWYSDGEAK